MLSEHASAQAANGGRTAGVNDGTTLPALGFEPSQGGQGQSYGLDELAHRHPPFSIGRVQYPLTTSLLALACASNVLVLVVSGSNATSAPKIVRIDLAVPDNERTIELFNPAATTASNSNTSSTTNRGSNGGQQQSATTNGVNDNSSSAIHKLFLDPSGRHVLVSTPSGDNYYFFSGWEATAKRARLLPKLRGTVINAVSWNSPLSQSTSTNAQTTTSTKEILLGDINGNIYECVLDGAAGSGDEAAGNAAAAALRSLARGGNAEKHFKLLYTISSDNRTGGRGNNSESAAITGLKAELWSAGSATQNKRFRAAVIATTQSRLYQFVGTVPSAAANVSVAERDEGGMYEDLFKIYRDTLPKSLELPGELQSSELHFWQTSKDKALLPPRKVAWMTGPGIYSGALSYSSQEPGDGIIDSAQLVPYPSDTEAAPYDASPYGPPGRKAAPSSIPKTPISMAMTEHHFVLLYQDRVKVIRTLDDRVIYEESLDVREDEKVRGLATDVMNKTYWLYTDSSIFELSVTEEDQDLWSVYLEKQAFESALKYTKTPKQRSIVNAAQGDAYFTQGRYIQSAEAYAQSTKSFEEVVLRFTDKDERDALRYYLVRCLERLKKNDLTQRMMLATWLVEIYLSKINQLEDIAAAESASDDVENYRTERAIVEDDIKQFLQQYKDNLDKITVFDLIASHGRSDLLLHYASVVGDYGRIVAHWIEEEDWQAALLALARQDDLSLYYRYAPVLMRHAPKEAINCFQRQSALQPRRLIPALVQPGKPEAVLIQQAVRYFEYIIFSLHHMDPAVHNALLTLLATRQATTEEDGNEDNLLHFLQTAPIDEDTKKPFFDLDYALRVCKANGRVRACVEIYSKMGLYETSVELALKNGDIELAKYNADLPVEDELQRKKLWLKIAKHVVQEKNDLKTAMQFLESTPLLKIEDILPFFPDFITIDDFKEDICDALEDYGQQIEKLKAEMNSATEAAEAIKRDIADLRNRFVVVDAAAKCDSCGGQLLARQFYVFPCQHAFHADCLIREVGLSYHIVKALSNQNLQVTQHLPTHTLRRVLDLQNQIAREAKENDEKAAQITGSTGSDSLGLEALGMVSGRKLAQASVQGLDQLRKLVIPDALVTVVGGGILGAVGRDNRVEAAKQQQREMTRTGGKSKQEKMREELDDLLASKCVYCETAVSSLDKPFLTEREEDL